MNPMRGFSSGISYLPLTGLTFRVGEGLRALDQLTCWVRFDEATRRTPLFSSTTLFAECYAAAPGFSGSNRMAELGVR